MFTFKIDLFNGDNDVFLLWRIFFLSLLFGNILTSTTPIQVNVEQGKLSGSTDTSRNGKQFYAFYSVPYAKPPIGARRFQPPLEPEKWNGVRSVTSYPPACTQQEYGTTNVSGQEDCLYLNVFSQQLSGSAPVLVYFHGGGFKTEYSSLYPPNYIMDHQVILVTVQYRLGLFGFLSSGNEALPGNNGMKDQVMALKWIKKNIASFGGDPQNVLLFGQNAGGGSVHLHMYSPMSKGLFHKGLSISGTALSPWSITPPRFWKETFRTVVYLSGCLYPNISDSIQCLKNVPANELILTHSRLYVRDPGNAIHTMGPTVEINSASEENYLVKRPRPGGELNPQIPWMFGQTSAEGIYKVQEYLNNGVTYLNDDYRRLLPIITLNNVWLNNLQTSTSFAEDMKKIYFKNADIGLNTLKPLVDLITDSYFTFGVTRAAFAYKGTKKYLYLDDYRLRGTKIPYDDLLTSLGVCHGVDLLYYFNYANITVTEEHDLKISVNLVKMLANFAYTGDPNIKDVNFKWDPVTKDAAPYLHISDSGEFKAGTTFFKEKNEIWKKISKYFEQQL